MIILASTLGYNIVTLIGYLFIAIVIFMFLAFGSATIYNAILEKDPWLLVGGTGILMSGFFFLGVILMLHEI